MRTRPANKVYKRGDYCTVHLRTLATSEDDHHAERKRTEEFLNRAETGAGSFVKIGCWSDHFVNPGTCFGKKEDPKKKLSRICKQ